VLPVDVQRLQIELNRQRRIQRQVERLAGRLTEIADEQRDSFLADDAQVEHLHQLSAELIELASDRIEKIVADLDAARRSALTRAQPDDQEGSP
jgi:hypothetical protein